MTDGHALYIDGQAGRPFATVAWRSAQRRRLGAVVEHQRPVSRPSAAAECDDTAARSAGRPSRPLPGVHHAETEGERGRDQCARQGGRGQPRDEPRRRDDKRERRQQPPHRPLPSSYGRAAMQWLPGQRLEVEAGDEVPQQRSSPIRRRDRRERVEPAVRGPRGPGQVGACQIHFHDAASERPVQQRLLEHDALEPRHPAADIHARQQTAVHAQAVAGAAKREVMQREERERDGQQADEDHEPEQQHQQHKHKQHKQQHKQH